MEEDSVWHVWRSRHWRVSVFTTLVITHSFGIFATLSETFHTTTTTAISALNVTHTDQGKKQVSFYLPQSSLHTKKKKETQISFFCCSFSSCSHKNWGAKTKLKRPANNKRTKPNHKKNKNHDTSIQPTLFLFIFTACTACWVASAWRSRSHSATQTPHTQQYSARSDVSWAVQTKTEIKRKMSTYLFTKNNRWTRRKQNMSHTQTSNFPGKILSGTRLT